MLRQIGSGGMGDVYLGWDARLNRQVAIKVVRGEALDQEALDRFFREARAAAALRHPNIVTIYASGRHGRQPYMVMEFVDGESLSDVIRQRRNLMLSDKLSYLEQVCAGLHYAHQSGIVHRDIKPANVMVDRQGAVRILDFGIARIEGSAMTLDGTMVGSLNYMSPEQMLGRTVDHRSDMFSLGCVAYELLCYQQAFKGSMNDGLLHRLPHEDPPALCTIRKDLPEELERIVGTALQKAPDNRYPDLNAMRDAILDMKRGLGQDDVRTIVIRPRGRTTQDAAENALPTQAPAHRADTARPDPFWSAAPTETPDAEVAAPAWAFAPPTRVVQTPAPSTAASAPAPTTGAIKSSTAATTRTRLAETPMPLPSAQPPPVWQGVLVGSILGICLIAVLLAISWTSTPPPTPWEREGPAIDAALGRFRVAYRTRDLEAMMLVFPTIPPPTAQDMRRTFDTCLVYEVIYDGIQVELDPTDDRRATAHVHSRHTCTPKSGGRETTTDRYDILSLRKEAETWLVDQSSPVPNAAAGGPR